jgi:hypothetical protein
MIKRTAGVLSLCVLASLSFLTPSVNAIPAGAAVGMDIDLIKNVKNYVLPDIINHINALVLPRIDYKGGYVDGIHFNIAIKSLDSIQFNFDPATNSLVINCQDIFGQVKGNFKQKLLLISASGWFKADFKDRGIGLTMKIPIHNQLVNGRNLPKIELTNFNLGFDTSKIVITLGGGILADIGDIFTGLFKSTIIHSIANGVNGNIPTAVNKALQSSILASNGILPIYKGLAMDIQFPESPLFTQSTMGIYLNATFVNTTRGYKVPSGTPVQDIYLNLSSTNEIMIDASRYSVDSFILNFFDGGYLKVTLD